MSLRRAVEFAAALALVGCASAAPAVASCVTHTLQATVPTSTPLAFREYSYCGGTLTASAYIDDLCYNKLVYLYYSNGDGEATPMSVIQLGYTRNLPEPNPSMQIWSSVTPNVNIDGIKQLINITYAALDVGEFYSQNLSVPVVASGPKPTTTAAPVPYASPTGFSQDITNFLAAVPGSQAVLSKRRMFNNIEVTGAAPGTLVAAQSYANPDYGFNWVRDSALTMDVVATMYAASKTTRMKQMYASLLFNYSIARATEQIDPNLQTGLGEPKFNLDNSIFTGPWGRPQNDGPASSAITLMDFSNSYLAAGGTKSVIIQNVYNSTMSPRVAPVMRDLLFVASNWSSPSFDLWEEEQGDHFYTRMVQYRALTMGVNFANNLGDSATAAILSSAATNLRATLAQFWDKDRGIFLYEYGPVLHNKASYIDSAVLLGLIHGANSYYTFSDPRSLSSAYKISTAFLVYNISSKRTDAARRPIGIPVGRYPEDVYNGYDTNALGNPWYLCTAAMAEFLYRAAIEFRTAGVIRVTRISLPFWQYYSPQTMATAGSVYRAGSTEFASLISSLQGWGDAYIRTVKVYTPANGHLAEEFNRDTGLPQGAIDLTWSYASIQSAAIARAQLIGDVSYVSTLADIVVTPNATGVYHG